MAVNGSSTINKSEEVTSSVSDEIAAEIIQHFSYALSVFTSSISEIEDILGDAFPAVQFKEAVEYLKNSVNEYSVIQQHHSLDTYLKKLEGLENMASKQYENTRTLDTLDQQITLLYAILALHPSSHPKQDRPCWKLGEALIERFEHTDKLDDLDIAISHYSEAHMVGVDQYYVLQELTKCLITRFKMTQNVADLNKAINSSEEVLSNMPSTHPFKYYRSWRYLAKSYIILSGCIGLVSKVSDSDLHTIQSIITSFSVVLIKGHEKFQIRVDADDTVKLLRGFMLLDPDTIPDMHNLLSHQLSKLL
ncbi:hypothetical protein BDQ17DRAFT_1428317 [Cyathus striatus]|nr:hypothetical protein BDQ17DRAFT_1428317 [Cyathus striatus]